MSELACWNGVISRLEDIRIPALDRGFLFGDSVYEVIRVYHGKPFLLDEHLDRLAKSLAGIFIQHDLALLRSQLDELLEKSKLDEGIIYIQITRGTCPRKHVPDPGIKSNCLIYLQKLARQPILEKRKIGIKIGTSRDLRHQLCHIKSTNLLANVLALMEADKQGYSEVLLIDDKGQVKEGAHSSVAIIKANTLITPALQENILPGITRYFILKLAKKAGLEVREENIDHNQLHQADELILLGTTTEVMPVIEVDGQGIGNQQVGSWTKKLGEAFDKSIS